MLKSSGLIGLATITSRILGVIREALYAGFMGVGPVASAFKLAFMIPNLFRRLLGEGALTAAFIPIFKEKERREGEAATWEAANAVLSALIVAATGIIAVVVLGISLVLAFGAAPSPSDWEALSLEERLHQLESDDPREISGLSQDTTLMLRLLRLMFPYMLLICVTAVFMAMLNARSHFFIPASGALVLNLILIATVLFVAPRIGAKLETQIFALAVGVLVAGGAQLLYQLPTLYGEGFRWRWISPFQHPTVRTVVRRMVPGMMGVAAFQLNVVLTMGIAWMVDRPIVAAFDYAVRLMEFPQGVVGISLATFLLPTLSGLAADKDYAKFRSTLRQALGYMLFGNVIAAILLVTLARPIVRLIFEHGQFNFEALNRTVLALSCLAPSLIAYSGVNLLARAFYALGDTATPMKISSVCLGLNVLFVIALIGSFAEGGIGIANTLSSALNLYLLGYALKRKLSRLDLWALWSDARRILVAAASGGIAALLIRWGWESQIGYDTLLEEAGAVFVPMAGAGVVYMGVAWRLGLDQAKDAVEVARGLFRSKP